MQKVLLLFRSLDCVFTFISFDISVEADASQMGGSISHEYHYFAHVGDEVLRSCSKCGHTEKIENDSASNECAKCLSSDLKINHAVEIGHTFYLGNTYTKKQKANYMQENGKPAILEMGCHGIGVTRLIASAVESLSSEKELRWPKVLAPYTVCVIPPQTRSKEHSVMIDKIGEFVNSLEQINGLKDDVVVDDRYKLSIGHRLIEAKK